MRIVPTNIRRAPIVVLILAFMACVAAPTRAEEPLRWKFEVGEKLNYNMIQDMTLTMQGGPVGQESTSVKQHMEMDMTWNVEGVNDQGEAVVRQKINRVQLTSTSPQGSVEYDSDSDEPPTGTAAMVAPMFDVMTDGDFEITITARGEVKDVKIPDEMLTSLKNSPAAQQMGEMATAEGFKKMLTQGAFVLPEKTPSKDESWTTNVELQNPAAGKQTVTTKYTYLGTKEVDGRSFAEFRPELTMSLAGTDTIKVNIKEQKSDGEVLFDVEEGQLASSKLSQNVAMDITVGDQTMEQTIDQSIAITLKPDAESIQGTTPESSDASSESEPEK